MMIVELFNKIYDSVKKSFDEKKWGKFIFKMLIILIAAFCVSVVIALILSVIISNIKQIIMAIGLILILLITLFSIIPKRRPVPVPPDNTIMTYDPITLENTYRMIRKNLCSVIGEVSDFVKLKKPASLSQMDTPTHYDVVAKAIIYHYIILKQTNDIDLFDLSGILQNTIEQKLSNHELDGIPQISFFYNGQSYPALMIDNIRDLGNYIQIDVAIASEFYCKYRESRIYNNMNNSNGDKPNDRDF